jgi:hypothetical protein
MYKERLNWDVYQISSEKKLHGVKLRGTLRKYANSVDRNLLVDHATDEENVVRFAVLSGEPISDITEFLQGVVPCSIDVVETEIPNPILSKLNCNLDHRYTVQIHLREDQ